MSTLPLLACFGTERLPSISRDKKEIWSAAIQFGGRISSSYFKNLDAHHFALGIEKLISRYEKCLNRLGDYVEKYKIKHRL